MKNIVLAALLATGTSLISQDASAFCVAYNKTVNMPASTAGKITLIARSGSQANARIAAYSFDINNPNSCTETLIQTGQYLTHCVKLWGTSGADWFSILSTTTTSYCGKTLYPVSYNGNIIDIDAGFGNDVIFGGSGDNAFNGGSGNDAVYASSYTNVTVAGSYGDDRVDGNGNGTARVHGDGGNDRVCAAGTNNNEVVHTLTGGAGTDRYCGSGSNTESGLDVLDCNQCTLF
jgi:hypothetical protein